MNPAIPPISLLCGATVTDGKNEKRDHPPVAAGQPAHHLNAGETSDFDRGKLCIGWVSGKGMGNRTSYLKKQQRLR